MLRIAVIGDVTNEEIEQAFDEAVASTRGETGLGLLWDASASETPVSADDVAWRFRLVSALAAQRVLSRAALLVRKEHTLILELFGTQLKNGIPSIESAVFSEESEARAWLQR